MTPLIQSWVSLSPDTSGEFHWFDLTPSMEDDLKVQVDYDTLSAPLPYSSIAVVAKQTDGLEIFLLAKQVHYTRLEDDKWESVCAVTGYKKRGARSESIPAFTYLCSDGKVSIKHEDGSPYDYRTSESTGALSYIALLLVTLQQTATTAYVPAKRANHAKRIRQGKVPLFDWSTVVIQPPAPKSESQGGTHASPRWHERRGHWRAYPSGKKGWVKPCEVGNKALGMRWKDYKTTTTGNAHA